MHLYNAVLTDPVDKYAKISRKKHPFKLLYKLHSWLHVCEISTETAKHGRNRQPHNSLNWTYGYALEAVGLKMISLSRMLDAKGFSRRLYAMQLT